MTNRSLPSDPIALIIVFFVGGIFVCSLVFFSLILILPLAAIGAGLYYFYHKSNLEKLRSAPEHVPATIGERTEYLSSDEFEQRISSNDLLGLAEEETDLYSCRPLAEAFVFITTSLYAQESFDRPPVAPETTDRITLGRYYDELQWWQRKVSDRKTHDKFLSTVITAYLNLRAHFPRYALLEEPRPSESNLTTPLVITDEEEATRELIAIFSQPELKKRKLFADLRTQIEQNSEGQQEYSIANHFAKTPFRALTRVQVPIELDDETRFAGMWVCAPQGMGKTTLLHSLIASDLEKDASIILMDTKGELTAPYLGHPALAKRRVVIGPDNPIGLNPLDIPRSDINKAVENLEYLFASLLDFKLTGTQSMLLKAVLRALVTAFPDPNLTNFHELMAKDGGKKYAGHLRKLDSDLQNFFVYEYNSPNIRERRQEVLQRLRLLLDHDVLRTMLMAPKTTFRISEAMDQGAIVIIDNSRGKLGNKGAEFLGRFFIAQVLAAAQERSFRQDNEKKPVYFYIDEAHTVVAQDERITDVYHECRSQRIALCCAHQETTQVSEKVLSAFQNCAIRFAHPDEETRRMAISLRMEPKKLQSLRRGQFGAYIRGRSKGGIVVNVQKPDLSQLTPSLQPFQPRHLPPPTVAPPPAVAAAQSESTTEPMPVQHSKPPSKSDDPDAADEWSLE
jgi:hypothetical protein